jgi:hypothetical protein
MAGLSINTSSGANTPDTRLTQEQLTDYYNELDEVEDRVIIRGVLDALIENNLSEYQRPELERLRGLLDDENYKAMEISNTVGGILMRLKPSPAANAEGGVVRERLARVKRQRS